MDFFVSEFFLQRQLKTKRFTRLRYLKVFWNIIPFECRFTKWAALKLFADHTNCTSPADKKKLLCSTV